MIKDGNFYRWAHKSIQEYFAASYICLDAKEKESEILLSIYKSEKLDSYLSMFSLCYDMDYKKFSQVVILNLAKDFVNSYENSYLDISKDISDESIKLRKEIVAFKHIIFINMKAIANLVDNSIDDAATAAHMKATKMVQEKTGSEHVSSQTQWNDFFAICSVNDRLMGFINYLASKNEIEFIKIENFPPNFNAQMDEIEFNQNEDYIYLDDSKNNMLNSVKLFDFVTNCLKNVSISIFDYEKCLLTINKIEAEIKNESENNLRF